MAKRDTLYAKVISKDNLIRAWDHVRYDAMDDFAPDCFGYDDVGSNINELIGMIHEKLSSNSYQASPLRHVDVPKSTLAVRPGSVPEIEDRIVSYAILNIIAPGIDERMPDSVYSFRVRKDYKTSRSGLFKRREEIPFLKKRTLQEVALVEDWFYEWPEFYEVSKRIYEKHGYNFLSVTDVSSYFENINHEILRDQLLLQHPNDQKTVNLLMEILDRWVWKSGTLRRLGRGIPQGNDVSSFLGNVFLIPLDEQLETYSKNHDTKYVRYMDDVKAFSKSEDVARDVLFVMNNTLRDSYLNVQGLKTQILRNNEIEREFFPPGMEELNVTIGQINKAFKEGESTAEMRKNFGTDLRTHYRKISRKRDWGKHERRLFSRLLTGFKAIESKAVVRKCLNEIRQNPDAGMNAKIISYLKLFPGDRRIASSIGEFLLSDINKFEYQEAHLFLLYRYLDEIPSELFDYMMTVAFEERRNWFNRIAALVGVGSTRLDSRQLTRLRSLYDRESDTTVRRAIALCLAQLDRNNLFAFVKKLKGELESHLTTVGNYYEKIIFDAGNRAQKMISVMDGRSAKTDFYKEHFYTLYLLAKAQKRPLIRDLANLLRSGYREVGEGKFREQIRYLYKEITNVDL